MSSLQQKKRKASGGAESLEVVTKKGGTLQQAFTSKRLADEAKVAALRAGYTEHEIAVTYEGFVTQRVAITADNFLKWLKVTPSFLVVAHRLHFYT